MYIRKRREEIIFSRNKVQIPIKEFTIVARKEETIKERINSIITNLTKYIRFFWVVDEFIYTYKVLYGVVVGLRARNGTSSATPA